MRSSAEQVKSLQITQFVSNDKQKLRNLWLTEKSCGVFSIDSPPPHLDYCWMILISTL